MNLVYTIYLVIVFFLCCKLSLDAKNKVFAFCLFGWVLAQPILNSREYIISFRGLFFDLHPDRILLPVFLFLIFRNFFHKKLKFTDHNRTIFPFERWIIFYLGSILLALVWNILCRNISIKDFIVIFSGQSFFALFYFSTRYFIDRNTINNLVKVLVIFSVFSCFVSLSQVFISKDIFHFGVHRLAFGEIFRATGIFHSEYTLAFFHITIIIFLFVYYKKYYLILLNCIPVALTFHRLSYLILITMFLCWAMVNIKKPKLHMLSFITLFLIVLLTLYSSNFTNYSVQDLFQSHLYRERMSDDTISGRVEQWKNAALIMKEHLLGIGSYYSKRYYNYAAKIGQVHSVEIYDTDLDKLKGVRKVGYIVHNGFLGAGTRYGIFGCLCFLSLSISCAIYFLRELKHSGNEFFMIPLLVSITWILYNTTQDFSNLRHYHAIHFAIILGISSSVIDNNLYSVEEKVEVDKE